MRLARVIGQVWGARQAEHLGGHRLLRLQPLALPLTPPDGLAEQRAPLRAEQLAARGELLVAVDGLGAGPGELVLVAHGSRCRDLTVGDDVPTKEVVIAIVDDAEINARVLRPGEGAR